MRYWALCYHCAGIQHSLWLCVVTMTTVGYGDYAPKSLGGFIIMCPGVSFGSLFLNFSGISSKEVDPHHCQRALPGYACAPTCTLRS